MIPCVRGILWIMLGFWLGGLCVAAAADTYALTDGTSLAGDVISYNDNGVVFRVDVDKYSERVPWTKFSQEALQQLSKNPKIRPLAEPFIETPPVQRTKKVVVKNVNEVSRLELPPTRPSLLGALFSSPIGLVSLMLIYAANIFAGYEIAVVRSRPLAMVMGLAVVLPILGPLIFLVLPVPAETAEPAAMQPMTASQTFAVPSSAQPAASGIHIVEASWQGKTAAAPAANANEPQVFQRGQFTFNRRFFETKFSGFFPIIRREAEKNLVLTIKTGRANLVVERITRITTNEMHVETSTGGSKQEVVVPFAEVVEVQLRSRAA